MNRSKDQQPQTMSGRKPVLPPPSPPWWESLWARVRRHRRQWQSVSSKYWLWTLLILATILMWSNFCPRFKSHHRWQILLSLGKMQLLCHQKMHVSMLEMIPPRNASSL